MHQRSQKQMSAASNKNLESVSTKLHLIDKLTANFEKGDEKARNEAFLELHALTREIESNNRYRGQLSDTWGKFADGYEKLFKNSLNDKLSRQSSERFAECHYVASITKVRIEGLRWNDENAVEEAMINFATSLDYSMLRVVAIKDILEKCKNQPLSDQEILVYENAIFDLANDYVIKNNQLLAHQYYHLLADKGDVHKVKAQQYINEQMNARNMVKTTFFTLSAKVEKSFNNTVYADTKNSDIYSQTYQQNQSALFHSVSDMNNIAGLQSRNEVRGSSVLWIELPVWKSAHSRSS